MKLRQELRGIPSVTSGGVAIGTSVIGGNVRLHEPFKDRQIGLGAQALRDYGSP